MKAKPTVHIIMATYNGEDYLEEQLESLLCQTYPHITLEICDDGSCDRTLEIIGEYQGKYSNVTLHQNPENKGYVLNFLEGIRRSKADYIMLCDQDDIWNRDKVEITLKRMLEM
nr:glycosyltransferase [Eubacterium sp.]